MTLATGVCALLAADDRLANAATLPVMLMAMTLLPATPYTRVPSLADSAALMAVPFSTAGAFTLYCTTADSKHRPPCDATLPSLRTGMVDMVGDTVPEKYNRVDGSTATRT